MASVMIKAASFVEEKEVHLEEIIKRLLAENQVCLLNIFWAPSLASLYSSSVNFQGLRELLAISNQFGSVQEIKRLN